MQLYKIFGIVIAQSKSKQEGKIQEKFPQNFPNFRLLIKIRNRNAQTEQQKAFSLYFFSLVYRENRVKDFLHLKIINQNG